MSGRWLMAALALGCGRGDDAPRTAFDGVRALALVETQLAFGPRVPGTEAHRRCGDWLAAELRTRADTVVEQRWAHVTAAGDTLPLRNLFARFRPGIPERVLLVAHWDSRPRSDKARDPARRALPVPGANDGASGVAVLLALAEALEHEAPLFGVDLLLVDGEDYGEFDARRDVLLGSTYFASHLPEPGYRPLFGVLLDMVGDADLRFLKEIHSLRGAPEVVARVWQTADALGYGHVFVDREGWEVTDDHLPLLAAGLRVVDVVDIEYPWHHTPDDTADKLSARSLQIVGDVALSLVSD
ncbi:MAG TPA: M28 family peptidase [Gemmatimonadaceae bacterium]|nr:M28 family peptidase [Gemmatimonadaceae bacterium]